MIEAVQTSETSVKSYQSTRRCNPEDSHLHTHRHENLKWHLESYWLLSQLMHIVTTTI
jgi:hypothetical protein